MSWSFEFIAESKAAAKAEIDAQGGHMPQALMDVLKASIDEQNPDYAILVKSNGHVGGAYNHNATFEVRPVSIVRETTTG